MRFLCLHGKGTSARIFKSQTSTFRKLLPDNYTFDFIDGPYPDGPAAGIGLFYPSPYYKLYEHRSLESLRQGHKWLLAYINENGPYDAVMCFSQGCSLAASFLLYNQTVNPNTPPPFKAAIFICGGIPLDFLSSLGVHITDEARQLDQTSSLALAEQASTEAILRDRNDRWGGTYEYTPIYEEEMKNNNNGMVFGFDTQMITEEIKIKIPTVHVFGRKDPRFPASITLAQFCDGNVRRTFDHGGGHEIPRRKEVSAMMSELVEWSAVVAGKVR